MIEFGRELSVTERHVAAREPEGVGSNPTGRAKTSKPVLAHGLFLFRSRLAMRFAKCGRATVQKSPQESHSSEAWLERSFVGCHSIFIPLQADTGYVRNV